MQRVSYAQSSRTVPHQYHLNTKPYNLSGNMEISSSRTVKVDYFYLSIHLWLASYCFLEEELFEGKQALVCMGRGGCYLLVLRQGRHDAEEGCIVLIDGEDGVGVGRVDAGARQVRARDAMA